MSEILNGGRPYYGYAIGIILLDTRFPRGPGDIGNATSYEFPVVMKSVKGADIRRAIKEADPSLLKPFTEAAVELQDTYGVRAITTSCGFLSIFQDQLARAVHVPLFTSNLLMVPVVHRMTQRRVGIITASADSLTERHLRAANIDEKTPIATAGLETQPEWLRGHLGNSDTVDHSKTKKEVLGVAVGLKREYPDIGSFVFECHNLAPYSTSISETLGVPVFDIISFVRYLYYASVPRRYEGFL